LQEVRDGSGSLISTYYYDPFGRRLWKEVNGVRTYFVYADEGLIAAVDAAGNVNKSYGYRPGSTWTTDPLFMKVGGQYYFYHNDHLGTPQKLTAVNGAVVWSAKYSSFGDAEVIPSSTIINNLRFPGQYFDQETGLHYNLFRYYCSETGRYLRTDPIGSYNGTAKYIYASLNPLIYIDPFGLKEYVTVSGALTANFPSGRKISVGGEAGVFFAVDPCSKEIHGYNYWGAGIGDGKGFAGTVEIGVLRMNKLTDIAGHGWAISGFVAQFLSGFSGQIYGNFKWFNGIDGDEAVGASIGRAVGSGKGRTLMYTNTQYLGEFDLNELPPDLKEVMEKVLETIEEVYKEQCQKEKCEQK